MEIGCISTTEIMLPVVEPVHLTLKYLKNSLKNEMTNEYPKISFMLMTIENKIPIEWDNNIIINAVGENSKNYYLN